MKRVIGVALALLLLTAWSGERPAHAASGGLSVRIVLPAHAMRAGTSMTGRVIVDNETGATVHVFSCGSPFAVALRNQKYQPNVVWTLCRTDFPIPEGKSTYKVFVAATYLSCSTSTPTAGSPLCLPGSRMPPLAPGRYQAALYQQPTVVPQPHAVAVRVIAAATK